MFRVFNATSSNMSIISYFNGEGIGIPDEKKEHTIKSLTKKSHKIIHFPTGEN
jgi:hypothetical protein